MTTSYLPIVRCCYVVKDRKNESHSQLKLCDNAVEHDVVMLSKIEKMKAIHNKAVIVPVDEIDVVMLSKIEKMKAIHNSVDNAGKVHGMLLCCQR